MITSKFLRKVFALMVAVAVTVPAASFAYLPVSAEVSVSATWNVDVETGDEDFLPYPVNKAFESAASRYKGGKLVPVVKYGSQVVAGYNYQFICKNIADDGTVSLKNVTVYDYNYNGWTSNSTAMISSIEDFNIEDYEYDYKRGFSDSRPIGGMYISISTGLDELPYDVSSAFEAALPSMNVTSCEPIAYLGKRVDSSGTDFALLCYTQSAKYIYDYYIDVVVIHRNFDGSSYQKTSYSIFGERTNYNNIPLENRSDVDSSVVIGDWATVYARGYGSTHEYTYAALYKKKTDKKWTVARGYSDDEYIYFKPAKVTEYDVCVKVKDSKGNIAKKFFTLTVYPKLKNTSTISATTIKKGDTVTVSGSATGGRGSYDYAVLYKKKSETKWTVRQGYKENSEIIIRPYAATDYDVCIKVMDWDSSISKKYFTVTVTK